MISTHAPRTGSDGFIIRKSNFCCISTHAPRTGSDAVRRCIWIRVSEFQPTLPARGATRAGLLQAIQEIISTHAPRTGSDAIATNCNLRATYFNPRSPHGERRIAGLLHLSGHPNFNPRSPHGERPCRGYKARTRADNFNPRSPHGERQGFKFRGIDDVIFQPTLPARGATGQRCGNTRILLISTHAPRTGSDNMAGINTPDDITFQPTLPARGATARLRPNKGCTSNFNPRSPHGERRCMTHMAKAAQAFQPTLPARGAT